ncbi:MAG: hypothetical protein WD645_02700 [Dehalococcoidia bacterium]
MTCVSRRRVKRWTFAIPAIALLTFLTAACYPPYEVEQPQAGAPRQDQWPDAPATATQTPEPEGLQEPPAGAGGGATTTATPTPEPHAIAGWMRGVTLSPRWADFYAYSEFKASVDRIAETNANYVTLVIPLRQSNAESTDIGPTALTPEDWVLSAGIRYVHSKCMNVMLKPHIELETGEWQANIDPPNRAEWFRNYGAVINHYAVLAEREGVALISIGAELNSLTSADWNPSNTQYWRDFISELRSVYTGELTYSGQWGPTRWSVDNVQFLDDLDYIGISAFFDLKAETDAVAEIEEAWARWDEDLIRPLYEQFGKPVLFTEVGYRNQDGARKEPWDDLDTRDDEQEQANLYEALMSYWSKQEHFGGVFWWEWRDDLGPDNTYYTPNDKLAEDVLTRWFGQGVQPSQEASACRPQEREDTPLTSVE